MPSPSVSLGPAYYYYYYFFKLWLKNTHTRKFYPFKLKSRGLPWTRVVATLPSNTGSVGSVPRFEAKIPQDSWPQNQNIKFKQYCKKFNKGLKKKQTKKPKE